MKKHLFNSVRASIAGLAFVSAAATLPAITIDFETGYSAGNLNLGASFQPTTGTKWGGGTTDTIGSIQVATSGGNTGFRAVTQAGGTLSPTYIFTPSASDLGSAFQAGVSKIDYSFDLALSSKNADPGDALRVRFGNSATVQSPPPNTHRRFIEQLNT